MFWPVFSYLFVSVAVGINLFARNETDAAIGIVATAFLVLAAAGGLKHGLLWAPDNRQRISSPLIATALFGFAYWLSTGFSVNTFAKEIAGPLWASLGALVGLVFLDRRMTS